MGRTIRSSFVGTRSEFENARDRHPNLMMIPGADVYWSGDGSLYLVAPRQWVDYLHGKTDNVPVCDDEQPDVLYEISDESFEAIITV